MRPQDQGPLPVVQPKRRRSRWWWLGPLASVTIFLASLGVLWTILQEIDGSEVTNAFANASSRQLWLAAAFAALSYLLLTGYDALAVRGMGLSLPYRTTALGSFTSYAVSFTLGFPLVTAATVRYWIYSRKGLRGSEVFELTLVAGVTFWLGMGAVLGTTLIASADAVARLARLTPPIMQAIGVASLLIVVGYLVWVSTGRRTLEVRGWRLRLPGFGISLGQIMLGIGDVCAGAAVLFILLPGGHGIAYETFLAVYVFAALIGIASHAPGGLGVFEATILIAFAQLPREPVLGALLLFRVYYYLVPFVLALSLLALTELGRRIRNPAA